MESNKNKNIQPFNGDKYTVWKFRIINLLSELNVSEVITSEPPVPVTTRWLRKEQKAKNAIIINLSDAFLNYAENNTAKEVLNKLDAVYQRKSIATQLTLRKKLLCLKLEGEKNLNSHFLIFEEIISDLIAAGAKIEETDKVAHLLLTLPKSYNGVITAIETLTEDNITLSFVKNRLLDHEVKLVQENASTSLKVLQTTTNFKNNKNFKKTFKTIKFKKSEKFNKNKNNIKCFHCGKMGHMKANCFLYKKEINNKNENTNTVQLANMQQQHQQQPKGFAFMLGNNSNQNEFILDSGASDHLINDIGLYESYINLEEPIKISVAKNNTFINATKIGIVKLLTENNIPLVLQNVLFCEEVPHCLMSVRRMQQAGIAVEFNSNGVKLTKNGEVILLRNNNNGLFSIKLNYNINMVLCKDQYDLWHKRLGHISNGKYLEILNKNLFEDTDRIKNIKPNNKICEACLKGKQTRLSYQKEKNKEHIKRPLFIVHTDVCGPIKPSTIDEKNYYVIFVDQFTHYCVTYLIARKSEVFNVFKDFVKKSEAHFNLKIVNLYSDNGREYLSNDMKDFCVHRGITYHLTIPYSPQLNGVSERMIRYITETARAMLHGARLDKVFWGEAVLMATYLINRRPSRAIKVNKTPFELWYGKKPIIRHLKVFGSTMYVHNKTREAKLDAKTWKGVLVGYEPNGYKLWNVEIGRFETARDVVVDEKDFLQTRPVENSDKVPVENFKDNIKDNVEQNVSEDVLEKLDTYEMIQVDKNSSQNESGESSVSRTGDESISRMDDESISRMDDASVSRTGDESISRMDDESISRMDGPSVSRTDGHRKPAHNSESEVELRRSKRIKQMEPVSYENMMNECILNAQTCLNNDLPRSFDEIELRNDKLSWENAVQEELKSHVKNNTWTLVDKPIDKNIVDCKWVFVIKSDQFGNTLRYKARLVARGFTQEYPFDYDETFAPVARISSFRFMIAFANQFKLIIHQMDVKTAFLNGLLKEEIYMKIPQGLKCDKNKICKLNKAIYGLKQAARCWFEAFENVLLQRGFKSSEVDRCIYILDRGSVDKNIYVLLYVDDIVIATENVETMSNFKEFLNNQFEMTDVGEINFFIGIRVERENNIVTLSQSAYIKTILKKFNMHDCKPVSTPLPSKLNYDALNSDDNYDAPIRNLIGCLMYVMMCTRPDISTAVNILSRYANKANRELWQNLKRIIRYLKGSIDMKLEYKVNEFKNILVGFVDSDWGGGEDRKSTTGFLFKLFESCTISWNTRKQLSVAVSSTEAEYMALFEAVREAMWLRSLCRSFKIEIENEIIIFEDNQGCICIANNPASHKRSKHIDIKYHFSREQIENKIIKLEYICTEDQIADILTKPLPAVRFQMLRNQIGLS